MRQFLTLPSFSQISCIRDHEPAAAPCWLSSGGWRRGWRSDDLGAGAGCGASEECIDHWCGEPILMHIYPVVAWPLLLLITKYAFVRGGANGEHAHALYLSWFPHPTKYPYSYIILYNRIVRRHATWFAWLAHRWAAFSEAFSIRERAKLVMQPARLINAPPWYLRLLLVLAWSMGNHDEIYQQKIELMRSEVNNKRCARSLNHLEQIW